MAHPHQFELLVDVELPTAPSPLLPLPSDAAAHAVAILLAGPSLAVAAAIERWSTKAVPYLQPSDPAGEPLVVDFEQSKLATRQHCPEAELPSNLPNAG